MKGITRKQSAQIAKRAARHAGKTYDGYRVVYGTDWKAIAAAVIHARSAIGSVWVEYAVAGPSVMPEQRAVTRYAYVVRADQSRIRDELKRDHKAHSAAVENPLTFVEYRDKMRRLERLLKMDPDGKRPELSRTIRELSEALGV